jgi:2'-5' RNA ligase
MYGVVSLLDETHAGLIRGIWAELQDHCGLSGIRITPIPHFSWQIAEAYDRPPLENALREIAFGAFPLMVTTTGLGLFTGVNPVLYIPLVKDAELVAFHARIWKGVLPYSIKPSLFYAPQAWVPHITLAHGDTNAQNLQCAIQRLAFGTNRWEFSVDNLALIGQSDGEIGEEKFRVRFKEGS